MKAIDIHGMTNMELVRGETDEWYWATDYIHGDLYEAEELFRQGHPVRSNRLYLIHYLDGTVYEAVSSTNRSHFGSDLCFLPPFVRRIFRCFRPALPAFFGSWVKSGSGYANAQKRFHRIVLRCGSHQSGVCDAALMLSRLLVLKLAVWKTHPFGTFLSINIG